MVAAALAVGRTKNESPLCIVPDRFNLMPSTVAGQVVTTVAFEPSG